MSRILEIRSGVSVRSPVQSVNQLTPLIAAQQQSRNGLKVTPLTHVFNRIKLNPQKLYVKKSGVFFTPDSHKFYRFVRTLRPGNATVGHAALIKADNSITWFVRPKHRMRAYLRILSPN